MVTEWVREVLLVMVDGVDIDAYDSAMGNHMSVNNERLVLVSGKDFSPENPRRGRRQSQSFINASSEVTASHQGGAPDLTSVLKSGSDLLSNLLVAGRVTRQVEEYGS